MSKLSFLTIDNEKHPVIIMNVSKKRRRTWMYIDEADDLILARLLQNYSEKLSEADVCSALVSAALKASSEIGCVLPVKLDATTDRKKSKPK